jgi:hypothetical protein
MISWLSKMLDHISEFLAHRKGLLPLVGLLFIIANLALQFILPPGWVRDSNLLLHIGLIVSILGLMLAWAL